MHLHPKVIDLTLGRTLTLLRRLGHPERRLPPVVHVAGTNGKGSVVAYVRAAMEAAAYRVHVYTSPHLARFNERIRLAGRLIDDDALTALLEECETINRGEPITFFEITTAAALLAFARESADVVLLETGLGGRLDSTNVIDRPMATAITPVSLDHQQYLGETLREIAGEKAGILKPKVPCVVSRQLPDAERAIFERADEIGAPILAQDRDWAVTAEFGRLVHAMGEKRRVLSLPGLAGAHQIDNAGAAVVLLDLLKEGGFRIPDAAIAEGLRAVRWPARLQKLGAGPLVQGLPEGWQIWLDGGHNPAAGEILAAEAAVWKKRKPALPLHLICGMLNSKDAKGFLRPLQPFAKTVRAIAIPGEVNTLSAEALAVDAKAVGLKAHPAPSLEAALADIVATETHPARVMICGSLYLAGTVLLENG